MDTCCAPVGRDSPDDLHRRIAVVRNSPLLQTMMDALPTPIAILNENRQIVAANRSLLQMLQAQPDQVLGKRPGEVAGCSYSREGPDGCGTSEHCLLCGTFAAVLESQTRHDGVARECRLSRDLAMGGGATDLRVTATPVHVDGERLTVCTIEDISQQKRLAVLTRVFFHDVLNTAGGMQGYLRLLEEGCQRDSITLQDLHQLGAIAQQLVEEIESQRDLTLAESGDLDVRPQPVRTTHLLGDLVSLYSSHSVAAGRPIRLGEVWNGAMITDARLLARVLGNMLKNALEASAPGQTVTMRCLERGERIAFSVHNACAMADEVRLQIFHRSFSTKAATGRGIGTYSMRLLGQRYLGGKVEFASEEPGGTTFTITLPKAIDPPE